MGRVFGVSRHSHNIDVREGMECSGINGHYAEYVVAWKCNEKEYDCSLAVVQGESQGRLGYFYRK